MSCNLCPDFEEALDLAAIRASDTAELTSVQPTPARNIESPFARPLPHVRVGGISGLLELIAERGDGLSDIPQLAERLQLEVDDLLPLLDVAVLLGFAELADGVVRLSPIGSDFATTTILRSKDLFRQQALQRIPVISSIVHTLQEKANGSMKSDFSLGIWDDYFPLEEAEGSSGQPWSRPTPDLKIPCGLQDAQGAGGGFSELPERQLATTVDWGRYAELFEFNAGEGRLTLPD